MGDEVRYLAEIKVTRLDGTQERIETKVKAKDIEGLKRKVVGVMNLMEEGDL